MNEEILFRIPFTLYYLGFEKLKIETGRIRYKRYLSLFRKNFMDDKNTIYAFIRI